MANANFGKKPHQSLELQVAESTMNSTNVFTKDPKNLDLNQSLLKRIVSETTDRINFVVDFVGKSDINTFENHIMYSYQYGEPLLRFALTVIISLGALLKLVYQTYGMTGLPIFLIKGTKSLEDENDEI